MTVSSIVPVNNYTGNGSSTTFDFDFLIENESELVVIYKNKNAGNETVLTLGIDYSINETGNKNGSYITFPLQSSSYGVLSTEEMITLSLSLPVKQESEFENSSNLNLSVLEWTFDYIVRILQILTRKVERCVKVQEGDSITSDELVNNLYAAKSEAQVAAQTAVLEAQKAANSALESKNASLVLNTKANVDMDNITTAGMNKIKDILDVTSGLSVGTVYPVVCGKEYVPDGCLPCDGAEYAKAQFSDLWNNYLTAVDSESDTLLNTCTYTEYASDITTYGQCGKFAVADNEFISSNFTVVGSPTVTDDGIASGFDNSNYIKISTNTDVSLGDYEIDIHFSATGNSVIISTTISNSGNMSLAILKYSGKMMYFLGNGSSWSIASSVQGDTNVIDGTDYVVKLIRTVAGYTFKLLNVATGIEVIDKVVTSIIDTGSLDNLYLGTKSYWGDFTGSTIYNLKDFKIVVRQEEIFSGSTGYKFKAPLIKNGSFIQQALSDDKLGKSFNAGLPNITGAFNRKTYSEDTYYQGVFQLGDWSDAKVTPTGANKDKNERVDFDASRSSSVYGNSTTVQPNAVALRYFVVVANGQINQSQMDWSKWASSLQGKANTDLNNLSNNGKKVIDGQWISSPHLLSEATAVGTYTVDLSSYLPSDNYAYEVIFNIKTYHTTTCYVHVYTNDFPPVEFTSKTDTVDIGQYARSQSNTILLPVTQKQIIMKISTNNASENCLSMIAYRRIGTNT